MSLSIRVVSIYDSHECLHYNYKAIDMTHAWIALVFDVLFHGLLAEGIPSFRGANHLKFCLRSPPQLTEHSIRGKRSICH